jgi:hypothetical protein
MGRFFACTLLSWQSTYQNIKMHALLGKISGNCVAVLLWIPAYTSAELKVLIMIFINISRTEIRIYKSNKEISRVEGYCYCGNCTNLANHDLRSFPPLQIFPTVYNSQLAWYSTFLSFASKQGDRLFNRYVPMTKWFIRGDKFLFLWVHFSAISHSNTPTIAVWISKVHVVQPSLELGLLVIGYSDCGFIQAFQAKAEIVP